MVTNVTSLGRNGLYDWVIQRVSAVVIAVYIVGLLGYLVAHPGLDYATWKAFMGCVFMQAVNTIVFSMIAAHAWVGLWTVTTDYLTKLAIKKHHTAVRLLVQVVIALLTTLYLLLGLYMIWGGI
jgi:succinate dehydrogenase / fumarate reductase membrane anchor subunit